MSEIVQSQLCVTDGLDFQSRDHIPLIMRLVPEWFTGGEVETWTQSGLTHIRKFLETQKKEYLETKGTLLCGVMDMETGNLKIGSI